MFGLNNCKINYILQFTDSTVCRSVYTMCSRYNCFTTNKTAAATPWFGAFLTIYVTQQCGPWIFINSGVIAANYLKDSSWYL